MILFIRNVAQRHANQERNQTRHEDAQVVDFLIDVVVWATWENLLLRHDSF